MCVCVGMFVYRHMHVKAYMERSEGNLLTLVLSLYHVSPNDQTWVMILGSMHFTRGDMNGPECSLAKNDLLHSDVSFIIFIIAENFLGLW